MAYYDEQVLKAQKETAEELSNIRRLLYMKECRDNSIIDQDEYVKFLELATEKIRRNK